MKKIFIIFIIISAFIVASYADAPDGGLPGYFLDLGLGSRALSMGSSFVGVADDSSAIYWNPAGLINLNSAELSVSHINLFGGTSYDGIGFTNNIKSRLAYGVGLIRLYTGGIDARDENNVHLREISDENDALLFSGAYSLNEKMSLGSCFKYVNKTFDVYSNHWVALDLSLFYNAGNNLTLGLNMQNLTSSSFGNNYNIPVNSKFGAAYRLIDNKLLFSADIERITGQSIKLHTGVEGSLKNYLTLRAGYYEDQVTMGLGVLFNNYKIDLALLNHEMGSSARATFIYSFWQGNAKEKKKEGNRNEIIITEKKREKLPNYQVSVKILREIPTAVYRLFQDKGISVIEAKISNNTNKARRYKISYRIGLKGPNEIRKVFIPGKEERAVELIPTLTNEDIKRIEVVPTPENIFIEVEEIISSDKTEPMFSETYPVTLLPYDQFSPEIIDAKEEKYDLLQTLVSWVTYNDRILSEVLSKASEEGGKMQPPVKVVGFQPPDVFTKPPQDIRSLEERDRDYLSQIKLLYDILVKNYNIAYINQPVAYGNSQRIKLPFDTLKNKGNCIELSVLFASLLESIEIDPVLVIFPEDKHAAVGWKTPGDGQERYHILETNVFGESFDRVIAKGGELVIKNNLEPEFAEGIKFDSNGIFKKGTNVIIFDVKKIRESVPPSPYISR